MQNKKLLLLPALLVAITLSGCSVSFQSKGGGNDGGVYATANQGNTWSHQILIPTVTGNPGSIATLNSNALKMDPSDRKALYYGSIENGLYYSYDQGNSWNFVSSLGRINIRDVTIDPKNKCTIYISTANKVYKSEDCTRTWEEVYHDDEETVAVNTIAIDHYNNNNVYIGTSRGEIIKSPDQGGGWHTQERFNNAVKKIIISPFDSRIIFVATYDRGIHRTFNSGEDWEDMDEQLKDFPNSQKVRDIVFSESEPGLLFLANNYGLLKTVNHGDSWDKIELITPEDDAMIQAVTIGPKDPNQIYYVTDTTFYRSLDGGQNWATKKLPTSRSGRRLVIDPENPNILYLSTLKLEE